MICRLDFNREPTVAHKCPTSLTKLTKKYRFIMEYNRVPEQIIEMNINTPQPSIRRRNSPEHVLNSLLNRRYVCCGLGFDGCLISKVIPISLLFISDYTISSYIHMDISSHVSSLFNFKRSTVNRVTSQQVFF